MGFDANVLLYLAEHRSKFWAPLWNKMQMGGQLPRAEPGEGVPAAALGAPGDHPIGSCRGSSVLGGRKQGWDSLWPLAWHSEKRRLWAGVCGQVRGPLSSASSERCSQPRRWESHRYLHSSDGGPGWGVFCFCSQGEHQSPGDRKPPGASLKASSNLGAAGRTTAPPESACRSPWLMRRREGALSDGLAKRARSTWPHGSECVPLKVPKLKS